MKNLGVCTFYLKVFLISILLASCKEENPEPKEIGKSELFSISDMNYLGGFRISTQLFGTTVNNSTVAYSDGIIGYNPANHSLFVQGKQNEGIIAEFTIPNLVKSNNLSDLPMVKESIQDFSDVMSRGEFEQGETAKVGGLFYWNGKLWISGFPFYGQAASKTNILILDDADNIAGSSDSDWLYIPNGGPAAGGWISPIPADFQSALGGTHITGLTSSTARANTVDLSRGPACYVMNVPELMDNYKNFGGELPAIELVRYTLDNPLKTIDEMYNDEKHGYPNHDNKVWTSTSEASFGMIIPGTRTYLLLGWSSGHDSGVGYYDIPPYGIYKGYYAHDQSDQHAFYWMYDVNDLIAVKNGEKKPYEIEPYEAGPWLDAPFQTSPNANTVGGGSYDEKNGILYLSIRSGDNLQDGNPPVFVAYSFK